MVIQYFGFELWDSIHTTAGHPNRVTGRLSVAGQVHYFSSKTFRDEWADGYKKLAVSKKTLRKLLQGMSVSDFNEKIKFDLEMLCVEMEG